MSNEQNLEMTDTTGELTQEQMVSMLLGGDEPKGETVDTTTESGKPDAASAPEVKPEDQSKPDPEKTPEPKVLAKDGEHTIPYEKLAEARNEARMWKQRADEQAAQLAAKEAELAEKLMQAKAQDAKDGGTTAQDELDKLFEDFPELKDGVSKLVEARLAAIETKLSSKIEPLVKQTEESAATDAATAHFNAIRSSHADFESVVNSQDFGMWVESQPSFVREQYLHVCEKGSAPQIIEMLSAFKATRPTVTADAAAPDPKVDKPDPQAQVASKAQQALANVKSAPPNSLSDIPAGSAAHHDEAEAIREMNPLALMTKFEGKSPQEIMELMSRVI